jgi:hypothetical protein
MTLRDQQKALWEVVTGRVRPEAVSAQFVGTEEFGAAQRLRVYRHMYVIRLGEALRKTFPELEACLGALQFRRAAKAYLAAHPSQDPRIERAGRALSDFLASHPDPVWRAAAPTAALDWARNRALLSPDSPSIASVQQIDRERFGDQKLVLLPSLSVVRAGDQAWRSVWRSGFCVRECPLNETEARALEAARHGGSMGEVCGQFEGKPNGVQQAYHVIAGWFARGWIVDVVDTDSRVEDHARP